MAKAAITRCRLALIAMFKPMAVHTQVHCRLNKFALLMRPFNMTGLTPDTALKMNGVIKIYKTGIFKSI